MSGIPLPQEIPDIFIPPTPMGNARVMRGRNENSGMTTGGGDSFTPSGAVAPAKLIKTADLRPFCGIIPPNPPEEDFRLAGFLFPPTM